LPAKADPEKQRGFLKDTLNPLIEKAEKGLIELFFTDAAHFVPGGFTGRVWSKVRKYVRTASGRNRYNVLGSLNYVSGKVETVVNNTYITSTQVVEMLELLALKYTSPIKIILDNASYQRCAFVKEAAGRLNIELIFLPTYSPNLNLIERVWKFVKGEVLSCSYHETFDTFCNKISGCIDYLHTENKSSTETLITRKFHIIELKNLIS
jgi:transposase